MLFYENMLMGLMSLVIGIAIGSVLSKLFLELLVNMMGLNLNVHFEVPMAAIIDTAIIFFVIILYTSLQGYRLIYRFKLIELFRAEREGEAMPKGSVIMALISVFLIGSGYFSANVHESSYVCRLYGRCIIYFISDSSRDLFTVHVLHSICIETCKK